MSDTAKRHCNLFPTATDGLLDRKPLPFLPEELIIQILLWLPVRFLLQLKCVSKSWKTLISDPKFAKTHLRSITLNPTITHQRLFSNRFTNKLPRKIRILSLAVKPLVEINPSEPITNPVVEFSLEHRILGSCNGLLCLLDIHQRHVKLWNPSIRYESKNSPTLDSYGKFYITYHGFGYNHINDKYKVLVVLRMGNHFTEKVTKTYTFGGGNSWKTIQNFPCHSTELNGKFVSDTLNWVIVKEDVSSIQAVILSFDFEKEICNEVLLPEHDDAHKVCLGVLNNCLCVCLDSNKTHWGFWLMKKYGVVESWTRFMMIPCDKLQHHVQRPPFYVQLLFVFENGIVLLGVLPKFVLYNLKNGNLDSPAISYHFLFNEHIYHESLVSPQL
ncbi:hypothetical protein TSUD_389710 [Trifolium subterraneum]|uniref:F-box domain-containing protein n=1 Tax=Trifolium subterraneum TaxID=3900 RepID=A0A2Z6N8U4_TRISU|nr:hypothetical protein TSUD_389710 [Trifolium subterraneum]